MQVPLQITFRHTAASPAAEDKIRERAEDLERAFGRITACRVVVECRHSRRRQGNLFRVRVDLTVPGKEIVVGRDPPPDHAHEDVEVAVRDAFDAARRRLEDHARSIRGQVKQRTVPDHGRVSKLIAEQDYGFIATEEGEVYFHRNSVAEGASFDQLEVGDEVRFVAQHSESAEGLQASTVVPIGKHHLPPPQPSRR